MFWGRHLSQSKTATKELKIVTRPVVTVEAVKRDKRKLTLLHIINEIGEISEKAVTQLLYKMKEEKGLDLGYNFYLIADTPNSKDIQEDIRVLLYLGLIESDPISRKLRLTSLGKEFLDAEGKRVPEDELSKVREIINELRTFIQSLDSTTEMLLRSLRGLRRRRRRRFGR